MKNWLHILVGLFIMTLFFGSGEARADGRESPIEISEITTSNRSTLRTEDGSYPDWVELYNPSSKTVSLEGLILADRMSGKTGRAFPDVKLAPQGRVLVYADGQQSRGNELHMPFSIAEGETVYLLSAEKEVLDQLSTEGVEKDASVCRDNGVRRISVYPTPGYENTAEGFAAFQAANRCASALQINEVKVSEYSDFFLENESHYDWVELINASNKRIRLSDYYLSDDGDDLKKYRLPNRDLDPGQLTLVLCTEEMQPTRACTGFALNAGRESLFLSSESGVEDYVALHDIPYAGSYGRLPGENGFFYFEAPSQGQPNSGRAGRVVSEPPTAETRDGLFDGEKPAPLVLSGEGTVYYTTDGSYPTENSKVYTGPILITRSTVVRAVAVQGKNLPSAPLTCSYLLNENHSLPVISIVGNAPERLTSVVDNGEKHVEIPGSITMYENGERAFSAACGLEVTGKTSRIVYPKRSIKVVFRAAYGQPTLGCDLFGTGFGDYESLVLRAGQDASYLLFSNEIWQDLCLEMSDSVLAQHGKFCVVYLNGAYYGIYALKENISEQFYADWLGVDVDSVESEIPHEQDKPDYLAMYNLITSGKTADPEVYARICETLDVDSFIDWAIMEGVCGNYDLFLNVRFFRSTETGNRYQMALFDLDNTMQNNCATWDALFNKPDHCGFPNTNATNILTGPFKNPQFREAFLRRYGEVYDTVLSNERVLERIEHYEQLLRPEIERDRERWGYSAKRWEENIKALKSTIRMKDWQNFCVDELSGYIKITDEERKAFFD